MYIRLVDESSYSCILQLFQSVYGRYVQPLQMMMMMMMMMMKMKMKMKKLCCLSSQEHMESNLLCESIKVFHMIGMKRSVYSDMGRYCIYECTIG